MEKNKFLSKLNIKNYNNNLETILESKIFSSDVKNLLLSMLYKIENAYKDYVKVKVETISEREFLEYILEIIEKRCFHIELIDPDTEELPKLDKKNGKMICYPNEKSLLSSIWGLGEKEAKNFSKYEYIDHAMQAMINIGSNINAIEVIRDFNGWSWDIVVREIENIQYNILYQSLLLLNGKNIIYMSIKNEKYDNVLIKRKNEEYNDFLESLYINAINMNILKDKNQLSEIKQIEEEKIAKLELLKNKKAFVQKITNDKKRYSSEIDKIDKIINSTDLLREEYAKRNEKLPNKEKIFSISHLVDRLENERKEYINKIKNCNKMLDPKEFVKEKGKLEKELEFISKIDLKNTNDEEKNIADYCKKFLECAIKEIEQTEERADIINWIYKIRYYRYIPFNEEIYLKDVKVLEEEFKLVIKTLIKKAQKNKIWDTFSEDEELTYMIIKELFDSKMINLENANITCKYEKGVLYVEYYDTNIIEMKSEIKLDNVKIKKKIRLFI